MSASATDVATRITEKIQEIESRPNQSVTFIPSRYPYTYAYDYLRDHAYDFGLGATASRADSSAWLRAQLDQDTTEDAHNMIVESLALAYLREHRITITTPANPAASQ